MNLLILAIACLLALGLVPSTADGQDYKTPDGHEFSVSVKAEKPTIMLGETTFLSWEVKNLSATRLGFRDGGDYRNNIGRPESFDVTVVREDGKSVPQPKVTFSTGGLIGYQTVPVKSSYVRRLFVPHWATFEEPGKYTVTVTRTLGITGKEPSLKISGDETPWVTTKATTTLTVIKTDNDRLGVIIRETGTKMLNASAGNDARDAVQLLESIKDPRTVEYWIKAVHIYAQNAAAAAIHRFRQTPLVLATYDAPEAWAELKFAVRSKSDNVRLDVADAFSSSKNELALPLLVSMQDDPYYFVRLRVAQRLDKEKTDASTELLLKMLNDKNQSVWETAERSLIARDKMPNDFPLRAMSALECSVRQIKAVKTMQSLGGGAEATSGGSSIFLGGVACDVALKAFEIELAEQRAANNVLGEAWVLYQIADIYNDSRRYQQARDNYELALPLFRTLKNADAQGSLFNELAGVSESLKKYDDALKYFNEELSVVRSSSNEYVRRDEGRILDRMSTAHFNMGNDAAGIAHLLKRLDSETRDDNKYGQFGALKALGKAYEKIGKKTEALAAYEKALLTSKSFSSGFLSEWWDAEVKELTAAVQRLQ